MSQHPNTDRDDLERGPTKSGDPGADPYATGPDPGTAGPGRWGVPDLDNRPV